YAVDASWDAPDPMYQPNYPEEAFTRKANCNEAFMVLVDDGGSSAYYIDESDKGGALKLSIEIFDHQAVDSPNGMEDEVAAIWVEGDILYSPLDLLPAATILPGSGSQSSVYEVNLGNLNLQYSGETELFFTIESKNVTTFEPQVPGGNAYQFPGSALSAYHAAIVNILDYNMYPAPVVTSVVPSSGNVDTQLNNVKINGLNFVDGAVVEFSHHDESFIIEPLSTDFVNSSQLTVDIDLIDAPLGFYDVTVTNPDLQWATLEKGFEVIKAMWWKKHMYNLHNIGWNPTANPAAPQSLQVQWTSAVGGFKFCTPVVADDKIFFTQNSTYWERPDMSVYCFDLQTGNQIWTKYINLTSASTGWRAFSSPVWWRGPDGIDRLAVGGDKVYCFDADTGDQLWTYDTMYGGSDNGWWSNQMNEYDGMVLARSRLGPLYVLDFETGTLIKEIQTSSASEGGCTVVDGKLYINSNTYVDCRDLETGATVWSTQLTNGTNMNHWINPAVGDNRIYVTSMHGYVFCLSISSESGYAPGQIIWVWNDPEKPAGSTSMFAGAVVRETGGSTRLYIASSGSATFVYCLEDAGSSPSLIWRSGSSGSFEGGAIWSSAPGYSDGVIYCPDIYNGTLYAFDASNGNTVWTYYAGSVTAKCGVSIVEDMIVFLTNQNVRVFK
ncbi:MAG TPA: hypothetical protein ENN67_04550, partial [Firmicutes bacterium]|nr:hypothetical protein [Bacillota bacterium]